MTDELINKNDVVKIIKSVLNPASTLIPVARARRQMLNEINELESKPEPHWIPVTERLPEKSGEYLVTVKWVTGESDVDVYEYDARHKTWNDGESAGGERAVAWCELPEPYKGVTIPPECEGDCGWCKPSVIEKCKGVTE